MSQLNFLEDVDDQIKPPNGNSRLVEYGVQNESSDYRIHVGYKTQHVFVFPTSAARRWIEENKGAELRAATQNGMVTAKGYLAPISQIDQLSEVLIPPDIYRTHHIHPKDLTTTKGLKAVNIAVDMLKRQLIPLPIKIDVITDKTLQIKGTDILIKSLLHIQVKCDYRAGSKNFGGTGNVYLQVSECNPFKRY